MKRSLLVPAALFAVTITANVVAAQTLVAEDHSVALNVASTWTNTGIYLFQGDTVLVRAQGTINISGPAADGWQNWLGPEGAAPSQSGGCTECPLQGFRTGALIARVGAGPVFHVGSFYAFACENSGELRLGVNDNTAVDNRGDMRAFVWIRDRSGPATGVRKHSLVAPDLALHQNYPNPFNPITEIGFSVPRQLPVRITIYDVAGRRVRLLVDSAYSAGLHSVRWEGRDDQGRPVSSGVYFYCLVANRTRLSRKMLLLK